MFSFTTVLTFINLNIKEKNFQKPSEQNAFTIPSAIDSNNYNLELKWETYLETKNM